MSSLALNIDDAKKRQNLGYPFVLKSQLTVGGRGKVGVIQKCKESSEFESKFNEILNKEVKGNHNAFYLKKWSISQKNSICPFF